MTPRLHAPVSGPRTGSRCGGCVASATTASSSTSGATGRSSSSTSSSGSTPEPAAGSDDLSATVHYGELAERLHDAVAGDPVDLIETLAQRLADVCLAEQPVSWVEVTVHKPQAPIRVAFDDVSLTIHRSRDD